nr:hypothetical protein [Cupriavidus taiwanensis]
MKSTLVSALIAATALAGCGSKTDANEKNFRAAMVSYLDANGTLCLNVGNWPVDVTRDSSAGMEALAAAGIVSASDVELPHPIHSGTFTGRRYVVTEAGKKYYRDLSRPGWQPDGGKKEGSLCYGKVAVEKIVTVGSPWTLGGNKVAGVTYQYTIENLAEWANTKDVQDAFPELAKEVRNAGKVPKQHGLLLNDSGWQAVQ